MKADYAELMEIIDLWNYSDSAKQKIEEILRSESPTPPDRSKSTPISSPAACASGS